MDVLSDRYAYMISNAAKTVGKSMDMLILIEEDIYVNDYEILKKFIRYLVDENVPFTEKTLPELFEYFKLINYE